MDISDVVSCKVNFQATNSCRLKLSYDDGDWFKSKQNAVCTAEILKTVSLFHVILNNTKSRHINGRLRQHEHIINTLSCTIEMFECHFLSYYNICRFFHVLSLLFHFFFVNVMVIVIIPVSTLLLLLLSVLWSSLLWPFLSLLFYFCCCHQYRHRWYKMIRRLWRQYPPKLFDVATLLKLPGIHSPTLCIFNHVICLSPWNNILLSR